jgi:hypothetical protein
MDKTTLKKIMDFLKSEEDKSSLRWILLHDIESMPEKYFNKGKLELHGELITKLPKILEVTELLDLSFSTVTELPEKLIVGDNLLLYSCRDLKYLPDNLYVGGELHLQRSGIKEFPQGMIVNGTIWLRNSPLGRYTVKEIKAQLEERNCKVHGPIMV